MHENLCSGARLHFREACVLKRKGKVSINYNSEPNSAVMLMAQYSESSSDMVSLTTW